jgi:hypothetical protein
MFRLMPKKVSGRYTWLSAILQTMSTQNGTASGQKLRLPFVIERLGLKISMPRSKLI